MFFSFLKGRMRSRRGGFSLVEVLIALIILAVALLSLAQVPPVTTRLMASSIHHEDASLIAQEQLEFLEGCPFDSGFLSGDHTFEYSLEGVSRDFFDCSYSVTEVFDGNGKAVTVKITWDGTRHSLEIARTLSRFAEETVADDAR